MAVKSKSKPKKTPSNRVVARMQARINELEAQLKETEAQLEDSNNRLDTKNRIIGELQERLKK